MHHIDLTSGITYKGFGVTMNRIVNNKQNSKFRSKVSRNRANEI
jgi:hypothetical protein